MSTSKTVDNQIAVKTFMKPTQEEIEKLISGGNLSEILYKYITFGEYLVDHPIIKGWSPADIPPDPSHEKSIWVTEPWWYVDIYRNKIDSCKLKSTHNMSQDCMNTGNYFKEKLQAQKALEKIRELLISMHE